MFLGLALIAMCTSPPPSPLRALRSVRASPRQRRVYRARSALPPRKCLLRPSSALICSERDYRMKKASPSPTPPALAQVVGDAVLAVVVGADTAVSVLVSFLERSEPCMKPQAESCAIATFSPASPTPVPAPVQYPLSGSHLCLSQLFVRHSSDALVLFQAVRRIHLRD